MFVLRPTSNHTTIKYRGPIKKSYCITPAYVITNYGHAAKSTICYFWAVGWGSGNFSFDGGELSIIVRIVISSSVETGVKRCKSCKRSKWRFFSSSSDHMGRLGSQSCEWYVIIVKTQPVVCGNFKLHVYFWIVGWDPELPQPVRTLNISTSECGKLVKVILNPFPLWISSTLFWWKHSLWYVGL